MLSSAQKTEREQADLGLPGGNFRTFRAVQKSLAYLSDESPAVLLFREEVNPIMTQSFLHVQ